MKRTKNINHASFRKSWSARHLTPVALAVTAVFMLAGCGEPTQQLEDLPWQVTVSPEGNSQVFHLQTGKTTLKEAIERFHSFPELAVFSHESGKRHLEAYFGNRKFD